MSKTHWKKLTNPDYLGAYAIEDGIDIIATIKIVKSEVVTGPDGKKEECMVAHFKENIKPMILNATNAEAISKLYKTPYIEDWSNCRIQIGVEKVKAFGEIVEALRIRPKIPASPAPKSDKPIKCVDCGNEIKPFNKMNAAQVAEYTQQNCGKVVCIECAKIIAEKNKTPDPLS